MARPRKEVDEEKLELLASFGLTTREIAAVLDVSPDTIERNYAETLAWGVNKCRASLKRKQWEMAMAGNVTMLIWLGKQMLGQKDRVDYGVGAGDGGPLQATVTVEFVKSHGYDDSTGKGSTQ